jgi:hypothetical protein
MMKGIAVLSSGAAVPQPYGFLRMDVEGIDLDDVNDGHVLLQDSHDLKNPVLGYLDRAWIARGCLLGDIVFAETVAGKKAFELVATKRLNGISLGIRLERIAVFDRDGEPLDPQSDPDHLDRFGKENDLTFVGVRWQLRELSLVTVPADREAVIVADITAAQLARIRMESLQRRTLAEPVVPNRKLISVLNAGDDGDEDPNPVYRRIIVPDDRLVQYRPPGA